MSKRAKVYLGFDLGACSARAVLGVLEGGRLSMEEVSRTENGPVPLGGRLYWDFLRLWKFVIESMRLCARREQAQLAGIGVTAWGVDFGLLDAHGTLLANPICYRDPLTDGMEQVIAAQLDPAELYRLVGLPPSPVSTLSQLVALNRSPNAGLLRGAETLLMIPDLVRYFLCGRKTAELTAAASSQTVNVRSSRWCPQILKRLGLQSRFLPEMVRPGTVVGQLAPDLTERTGLKPAPVIAVAGHDTLSAAAAAPVVGADCVLVSCGTWSVIGALRETPLLTADALRRGFVNEIAMSGVLFARNVMGLYLFENLHRALVRDGRKVTYVGVLREARRAERLGLLLDVNWEGFFRADDPRAPIAEFSRRTGQPVPQSPGAMARALLEGLAWSYRTTLADLAALTGSKPQRICLIGGGSRNALLCQMVADATGLEVIAGPAEAANAGNLAVQALATGQLRDPAEIRELVRASFTLKAYRPQSHRLWNQQFDRYLKIVEKSKTTT